MTYFPRFPGRDRKPGVLRFCVLTGRFLGTRLYLGWGHRSRRKRTGFRLPVSLVCACPSVLLPLTSVFEVPVSTVLHSTNRDQDCVLQAFLGVRVGAESIHSKALTFLQGLQAAFCLLLPCHY